MNCPFRHLSVMNLHGIRSASERQGTGLQPEGAAYRIGAWKTTEPESPEPGEVGDTVTVKGKAYMLLLWEAGALPKTI